MSGGPVDDAHEASDDPSSHLNPDGWLMEIVQQMLLAFSISPQEALAVGAAERLRWGGGFLHHAWLAMQVDIKTGLLHLLAEYAQVEPEDLRALLMRLYCQPGENWPFDGSEHRADSWLHVAGVPPLLTLIDDWTPYLFLTREEQEELHQEKPVENVLPLLALPVGKGRLDLLKQAQEEQWSQRILVDAVHTELIQQGVPPSVLAAMDQLAAMIQNPARLGADPYEAFRQQVFELERDVLELNMETLHIRIRQCLDFAALP